jgi:class 3 adenylate cyclase/tetratricopeptide (TPR) repeat protein
MEDYGELFERERLTLDLLEQLTDAHLQSLGIPLGHRLHILGVIEKGKATAAGSASSDPGTPARDSAAERRQLTVMFCDLVGSTELSQQLDPETLREIMRAYQQACGQVVEKYEGHVAQYLGDGLMVYFGWPRAHEDDAERAIRSGLEILEAIKKVQAPEPLQVRIGIATGPVVVGETGAGDASVPKLAVGETPNVAARIQALAQADQILIGPDARRLVGATFELGDAGEHTLKGIVEPVQSWRVNGLAEAEGRFEAVHGGSSLTPLVGREEELEILLRRWQMAKAGEGQVVLVSGEPGIGKSRITRALREAIERDDPTRLRYQCSPFHTQSALYPVIEQFERAADFKKEDSAENKLDKMESTLSLTLGDKGIQATAPLIATLLSLPAERYPVINVAPQKFKELTLDALVRQVLRLAQRKPLLMVFEDAHWVDPTTQEVLDDLAQRIAHAPVLLLVTHRLEYVAPHWASEAHVTSLKLNRLSLKLGAELVGNVAGGRKLPGDVLRQVVEKTDGVPLFVEELTKTVLESGLVQRMGEDYQLDGPLPPLAIPSTLQDSLMARLDRLSEVREVAQLGACIGREFGHELLAIVSPLPEGKLYSAMKQLVDAELVFRRGEPPDATYTFKHALVQDAAYGSLLKSRRQLLHGSIAQALEQYFAERVVDEPEVLAHHYTEAGLYAQATSYWLKAGERGVARFSNAEAIGHTNRGLQLLEFLPEGIDRDRQELFLQVNLGTALGVSKGYTASEVGEAFERARQLSERVGETPADLLMLFGLYTYYLMRADYVTSKGIAERIMELAKQANDPGAVVLGHDCLGIVAFFTGDLDRTLSHTRAGIQVYKKMGAKSLASIYGYDPGTLCYEFTSWSMLYQGYFDQATRIFETGFNIALADGHPLTVATSKVHIACIDASRDDPESGVQHARDAAIFCKDNSILLRQAEAQIVEGWAIAESEDPAKGVAIIENGLALWQQLGAHIHDAGWYLLLAKSYLCAERLEDARRALESAFTAASERNEHVVTAELHCFDGQLRLAEGGADEGAAAERCFETAIDFARKQKAKLFELRASRRLARLWISQGKRKEAHDLLSPVYNWFTEGFDTKDLKEARALLEELA